MSCQAVRAFVPSGAVSCSPIRAEQLDFYNALNVSAIMAQNNTFGACWQRPISIMPARFAKVSLQFEF